jgi:DNA-binding SARP family transcriptional activator
LLGTVGITLDVEENSRDIPKSQAPLCYLVVTGQVHSREKLAGLLWGDKPEANAKANLRKALSGLRQLFGDALLVTRQTVAFNRESDYWLDVETFESALAEDDAASAKLDPLCEAVELYRGEFLEGFSVRQALEFEEWVLQERERLRLSFEFDSFGQRLLKGILAAKHGCHGFYALQDSFESIQLPRTLIPG